MKKGEKEELSPSHRTQTVNPDDDVTLTVTQMLHQPLNQCLTHRLTGGSFPNERMRGERENGAKEREWNASGLHDSSSKGKQRLKKKTKSDLYFLLASGFRCCNSLHAVSGIASAELLMSLLWLLQQQLVVTVFAGSSAWYSSCRTSSLSHS